MRQIYRPAKWQVKYYKEHRPSCGCGRCFNKATKGLKVAKELDYYEYIKSPLWVKRKVEYYSKHRKQCQACGSYKLINLHHVVYGKFGKEPDNAMVCLCQACHKEFHAIYPMAKNLVRQTNEFILHKQATIKRLIKEFG